MNDERLSTALSCKIIFASSCCRCARASNEIKSGASETPRITPVSCTGKNPFGTITYKTSVSTRVAKVTSSVAGWCRQDEFHCASVKRDDPVVIVLGEPRRSVPSHPLCDVLASLALIIGVSDNETTAETRIVTASVTANSRNKRPTMSPMNSNGISTAISETVSETIVKPICPAPFSAASSGVSPSSR